MTTYRGLAGIHHNESLTELRGAGIPCAFLEGVKHAEPVWGTSV